MKTKYFLKLLKRIILYYRNSYFAVISRTNIDKSYFITSTEYFAFSISPLVKLKKNRKKFLKLSSYT